MESKSVILGVLLIMGVVVAQIEAKSKTKCPSFRQYVCHANCVGHSNDCDPICGCTTRVETTEGSTMINNYCMLGCASSLCDSIITQLKSDGGDEEAKQAVEHCNKACSKFCNKAPKLDQLATTA